LRLGVAKDAGASLWEHRPVEGFEALHLHQFPSHYRGWHLGEHRSSTMQITHRSPEHNRRVLSRYRHVRLRQDSPRSEFRDRLAAPSDISDIVVDTISGARSIDLLVAEAGE
jgi:hypothetical protein